MTKFLTSYLLITGIGGFIALAMPSLVVIGLFLFILPGLILGAMPTLFMYGIVFTAGWMGGRALFGDGILAIAAGIAAVVAFGYMVPKAARLADMKAYQASILPDVTPPSPIELKGDILFNFPHLDLNPQKNQKYPYVPGSRGYACNNYCLAALFTPGVTSVTLAMTDKPSPEIRTYRLAKRPGCESNVEVSQSALHPPVTRQSQNGIRGFEANKVLASKRALQLGGEYCLVMEPAIGKHDFTIGQRSTNDKKANAWAFGPGRITTETIEILQGDDVLLRRHQSTLSTIGTPLAMMPDGMPESTHFAWGRETIHSKKGYGSVELAKSLRDHTNFDSASQEEAANAKNELVPAYRTQLIAALDNPSLSAESVEFKVMDSYLTAIGKVPSEEDLALIKRLFSDKRFKRYEGAWALYLTAEQMKPLYDAYTQRLIEEGYPHRTNQNMIAKAVQNMGPASIELIGPLQEQLLVDPAKRLAVPELARAMGYGEPVNAARLFLMLKQSGAKLNEILAQRHARVSKDYSRE